MNEEELIQETRRLIGRWDNIRIVGQGWAGDTRRGFQFNPIRTVSGGVIPVTPSGACCPITGDCFIATQVVCEGGGGTYQGDNTPCVPDPCTPDTGACCIGSDCSIETESDCVGMSGIFQGVDTTCSPNPCPAPTGACCVGTDCTIETETDCIGMSGTYQGDDTTCDPNPCLTGACCKGAVCDIETQSDCENSGGVYQGSGTDCDPNPCALGACCIGGVCSQTTESGCAGVFQGYGVPCVPDPCTSCSCGFLNPNDGRYYRTRALHVSADYSQGFLHGHYDSVKTETCSGGGITCASAGNGTFSYQPDGSCECTETFVCGGPAFGFFGLSGMTYMETCNDPSCGSAFILSCDFGGCSSSESFVYSDPCIPV